ncbi:MAG: chemotaxis protein CheW [Ramlibacter sp.]
MDQHHGIGEDAQAAAILRQRAAILARRAPAARDDLTPVLECAVAEQAVAIELSGVREVRLYRPVTPLPLAQRFVLGIVSLHGRMLPVLDLASLLALSPAAVPPRHLVVLGSDRAAFAVPVGDVRGVGAISLAEAAHGAASLAEDRAELVKGVTPDARLVVDHERLLGFLPAG